MRWPSSSNDHFAAERTLPMTPLCNSTHVIAHGYQLNIGAYAHWGSVWFKPPRRNHWRFVWCSVGVDLIHSSGTPVDPSQRNWEVWCHRSWCTDVPLLGGFKGHGGHSLVLIGVGLIRSDNAWGDHRRLCWWHWGQSPLRLECMWPQCAQQISAMAVVADAPRWLFRSHQASVFVPSSIPRFGGFQDWSKIFCRAVRSFWSEFALIGLPSGLGCRGWFKKTLLSHQSWSPTNARASSASSVAPCISSACRDCRSHLF